jgi:hypothetical protein
MRRQQLSPEQKARMMAGLQTPEAKAKRRISRRKAYEEGRYVSNFKGKPAWNKGKKMPEKSGPNHPMWIADRSKLAPKQDRNDSRYKAWRKEVWLRDNFKCKIANPDCAGRIEAHHILGWTPYPELRYEPNNGITLCHFHHPRKRSEEVRLSPYFQSLVGKAQ